MAMESQLPYQPPAGPEPARENPFGGAGSGLTIASISAGILAGSLALGAAGGAAWSAMAPRVAFQVVSPGSASLVNAETTGFIAGDLSYCLVAIIGGLIIGLGGYFAGVRRHGPVPMLAVLAGSVGAAYLEWRIGQSFGFSQFNQLLLVSRPGTILKAPLVLGAQGVNSWAPWALAFWPLAACLAAGGLTLLVLLRERRKAAALAAAAAPAGASGSAWEPR